MRNQKLNIYTTNDIKGNDVKWFRDEYSFGIYLLYMVKINRFSASTVFYYHVTLCTFQKYT